jgi:pimeloyl-ACP methyl ester carboxylesterase
MPAPAAGWRLVSPKGALVTRSLPLATALAVVLAAPLSSQPAPGPATPPAPCVTAATACTEWIPLGDGARSLVYRTYPLTARHDGIRRALVMVHGQGRDADNYFRTSVAAAFLAGALEDTLVVTLRLASRDGGCQDTLEEGEVNWPCSGNSWRAGGVSVSHPALTSYDFADAVLRAVARRDRFPALQRVVLAGHSAGGQFASRYGMANAVHDGLGVPVTYVVSNPSSYGYPEPARPRPDGAFGPYGDARNCTTFNRWPYGLEARAGYAARVPDDQLTKQLVARPVVYLLGALDTTPLAGFDASCPAMAQGPNRFERGTRFAAFVNEQLGARHSVVPVPLCGHNARCMFTSEPALKVLFPPL